jgi:hypothetical protein
MHKLSRCAAVSIVMLLVLHASARAGDEPTDAGVDPGAAPIDAAPPPPPPSTILPVESTPAETPPAETPDDETGPDDHKKKKKHKSEDEGTLASAEQGDIVGDESAQGQVSNGVAFRFLFQTRYQATLAEAFDPVTELDPRLNDGYAINRIFMRLTAKPKPWISAKVLIDFAEITHRNPRKALKLAYAELKLHKRIVATVGFFKRTYSLLELLPIAEFEVADVGPTDVLIKDAELAGRDPGAMIRFEPLRKKKWLSIFVGIFDGGLNAADARIPGLVTARVTSQPNKHVRLGIDGAYRYHGQEVMPGVVPATGPARAVSVDATYERKRFQIRGEWLWGDRSDLLYRGDARTFMAAWGIAAVRFPIGDYVLMPAMRFEWLDADREHAIGRRYLMSGAINFLEASDTVRVLLDVSRSQVQPGTTPLSLAPVVFEKSNTAVIVQVQVKI